MPTKVMPLNQHEVLHNWYGAHDCCLCRAESKIYELKSINENLETKIVALEARISKLEAYLETFISDGK